MMTHSLLGRSGFVNQETKQKHNYPPIDENKKDAVVGE